MYNLQDFIPFNQAKIRSGEHKVLVWSPFFGYYFTQYGFVIGPTKIIAQEV